MTKNENLPENPNRNDNDGPEDGATPEAVAMHGDQARTEQYPQPEAVTLDGGTRIATGDGDAGDERE